MKPLTLLVAALLLVAVPLVAVNAARFERGDLVTIPPQEFLAENLYAVGGQITVSSTGQKDVVLAGGKVIQNGEVWGDILAAGGSVDVLKGARGDVRVVGGQVTIQGIVGGDVTVAGGAVMILPGTTIAGDLVVAGGAVIMDGTLSGELKAYGGEVEINGTVAGPAFITAAEKVTFKEKAVFGNGVNYRAPEEATVVGGAKLGTVTYEPLEIPRVDSETMAGILLGIVTAFFIAKVLALMLAAGLAAGYFPKPSRIVVDSALKNFWQSLGIGFATLILAPIAALVLMATVVGFYLGLFLLVLYGLALLVAGVYVGVVTGALLGRVFRKEYIVSARWAVLGTVVISLISLIPILGWLVCGALFLASLGAVAQELLHDLKAKLS